MLNFPNSTEFNKRIPKQKFYENIAVTPAMKRALVMGRRICSDIYAIFTIIFCHCLGDMMTLQCGECMQKMDAV